MYVHTVVYGYMHDTCYMYVHSLNAFSMFFIRMYVHVCGCSEFICMCMYVGAKTIADTYVSVASRT